MSGALKFVIGILALIGLILIGLFLPPDETAEKDPFTPEPAIGLLTNLGNLEPPLALSTTIDINDVYSTREQIRSGKFQYTKASNPWTFTVPMDWGKLPTDRETRRVLQRFVIADPFLKSYAETGSAQDFQQAVFFMLDWQDFYQTRQHITEHAWDENSVLGRAKRLSYVLSQLETKPELLGETGTRALIRLADFHIQRAEDPEFGISQDTILQRPAFKRLCEVLDGLSRCRA